MSKLYQRKNVMKFLLVVGVFFNTFAVTHAQLCNPACVPPQICHTQYHQCVDPVSVGPNISNAFGVLYKLGLPAAILIGLGLIALNGYGLMTSDGDPRKVQESKDGLFSAIMGLTFVILAMVIYRVIVTSLIPSGVDQGNIF